MNTTLNERLWSGGISLRSGDTELPLQSVDIDVRIDGNGAVWVVRQTFENTATEAIEAEYCFPLPAGGAVNAMQMHIGDRVVEADIKERNEARVEYEEAVAGGRTAALLEQERAEIFTVSVGNIHPGEAISIVITVHDSVSRDGNEAIVRMPTLVKPRYVPGDVPDAARISPPHHDGGVHVNSTVRATFALPAEDLVCDTVVDAVLSPVSAVITDFSLDRDIVLRWRIPEEGFDAKWVPDADNPDTGTIEVTLRTDSQPAAGTRTRRAVSILVDRSGSMSGGAIEMARRVTVDLVNSLSTDDMVHVLLFDDEVEALATCEPGFVPATQANKARLVRDMGPVDARGGTELDAAIGACGAVLGLVEDMDDADGIERVVVLLTDGAYGDEATAAHQREHELRGARVIVVGIGQDMNGYLRTLAANGWFTSVPADHRTGEVAKKVCERVSTPAFRNARLEADGLTDQAPRLAPDVYPGAAVDLWARAPRPVDGATVRVVTDSGVLASIPLRVSDDASATTRWAKSHIDAMDWDVMTGTTDAAAGEAAIVAVSVGYRVLSKYTAWVAVDRSRTTDTIIPRRIVQPSYDSLGVTYSLMSDPSFALRTSMSMPAPSGLLRGSRSSARAMPRMYRIAAEVWDGLFDADDSIDLGPGFDLIHQILADLDEVLSAGRGSLDLQRLTEVLAELDTWLAAQPAAAVGKRNRGKITRRLDKLRAVDPPTQATAWRISNELLGICRGLAGDAPLERLGKLFPGSR